MTGLSMRQARISQGLTIKELAKQTGVAESAISRYERGLADMHSKSMSRIEAALGGKEAIESPIISELNAVITKLSNLVVSIKEGE